MKLILAFSILFLSCIYGASSDSRFFTAMYSLGDSYIDAGNFVIMAAALVPPFPSWHDRLPYGMTFFGHPTGRLSDGRNTIDFIGVNFAVGGAPVIDVDYFERNNIVQFKLLNNSLSVQLGWFEELRPVICNKTETSGCGGCFSKALFFVGEFGVNDYNFLWFAGKTEDEVMSHVPTVVQNIATAVEGLIKGGAVYVVVPGNPPLGCSPTMLTSRSGLNTTEYDPMGCLIDVNRVATHHNSRLRTAIVSLRGKYPRATIILADFYSPIIKILRNPSHYGMAEADALRACCGAGGTYNWNGSAICGMPGATACENPSAFVNWDGVHYTEATNGYIADWWLNGPFADPPIMSVVRY
ncbi:hypothetical protein VPH35_090196 [Triticum aestivum]